MIHPHLQVSVDRQELLVLDGDSVLRRFPVSTAEKGVGFDNGSFRTPTGRFRVSEVIGRGEPTETIFRERKPVGLWDGEPCEGDLILSRILRLEGLDTANANSAERFIYIHGSNHVDELGRPASLGCVRLKPADMVELADLSEPGTSVEILPPTRPAGRLIFFDCDSTLSSIEGIDELGRARGPEAFREVEDLTNAAMNGEVPIDEVFARRMEIIRPDRALCDEVAQLYLDTITPGTAELVGRLKSEGWTPVILSGGFAPLIRPLADRLGIRHVEAVPIHFADDGAYLGFDDQFPTTRNGGKPEVIAEWRRARLPEHSVMVGDGISDLEARSECDLFIGFGGVAARPRVKAEADLWIETMSEFPTDSELLNLIKKGSPPSN